MVPNCRPPLILITIIVLQNECVSILNRDKSSCTQHTVFQGLNISKSGINLTITSVILIHR